MYQGYRTPEQLQVPDFERLRVTLEGSEPPIWRELLVPENATFEDLHLALQIAFGWRDQHLHEFTAGFTIGPASLNQDGPVSSGHCLDERLTWLYDLPPGTDFAYTYDLGDSWDHAIERLEKIPGDGRAPRPWIVGGSGAGPAEDSQGVDGWNEMAAHLRTGTLGKDEAEWLDVTGYGRDLDPDAFDPESADERLSDVFFDIPATWMAQYQRRNLVRTSAPFLYDRSDAVSKAGHPGGLVGRDHQSRPKR